MIFWVPLLAGLLNASFILDLIVTLGTGDSLGSLLSDSTGNTVAKAVVDNTKLAAQNGATVISLSSLGKSPLTELADISLFTVAKETRYRIVAISSRIAELTVIDALYSYMSFRTQNPERMRIEKVIEDQMY